MVLIAWSTVALLLATGDAFSTPSNSKGYATSTTSPSSLFMTPDRRDFVSQTAAAAAAWLVVGTTTTAATSQPAEAKVFLDPAMYGDQENRVAAVDTLRERVRRAILQDPLLAPAFYQLALLDGLSYDADTGEGGPDASVLKSVLSSANKDDYTKSLQAAAECLVESTVALKRYTAITAADAIALGGAEAVQSIGGPPLSVQLGRTDAPKNGQPPKLSIDLFSGKASPSEVMQAFKKAGLTEREMTALLGGLLTIESVQKNRAPGDWKAPKAKFVERGKIGRMSDFKRLTEEDIAAMEDVYDEDPDDGWYIADSFGTREQAFGARIGKDEIDEKTFNRYLKDVSAGTQKKGGKIDAATKGWIATVLLDESSPTAQAWLNKYASSNLIYLKDLGVAFNSVTQLGAEYTGGKYESLLKDKKRKSLNDDELKLF